MLGETRMASSSDLMVTLGIIPRPTHRSISCSARCRSASSSCRRRSRAASYSSSALRIPDCQGASADECRVQEVITDQLITGGAGQALEPIVRHAEQATALRMPMHWTAGLLPAFTSSRHGQHTTRGLA